VKNQPGDEAKPSQEKTWPYSCHLAADIYPPTHPILSASLSSSHSGSDVRS